MNNSPLRVTLEEGGRLLRMTLARPKKNIVDAAMITAMGTALAAHREAQDLAAVLIDAEGPNFSFGASVEEHLPGQCGEMLKTINRLVLDMLSYPVPIIIAVRGYCLGGGLEVACAGSLIYASPDASFGQPEIQLAVFAPVASCLLPEKIGQSRAEDLLFSGRIINAEEAVSIGLINVIDDEPEQAAKQYIETQLMPRSSFTMRHAVWAARFDYIERVSKKLASVEKRYLEDLMQGQDPVAGLQAFMEKREPVWRHK